MGHAYLEDRGARREALGDLSNKGQVLESGVIVIQVQQVDKDCGTAGGSQGWPPTCRNGLSRLTLEMFPPFSPKKEPSSPMQTAV